MVENQANGAQGTPSAPFQIIEQTLTIDNLLGISGAVQVATAGVLGVVLGTSPTFTGLLGTALGSNEVVAVYDGATKLGNATINGNTWGFTPTSPLGTGFHSIAVMIQDANTVSASAGRVVAPSAGLTVDVGLLVPAQTVTIDWAIESTSQNGSVIGNFATNTSTDGTTPTVGGSVSTVLTGAQVIAVYDGTAKLGNATVVGQSWSFTTPALSIGSHSLTAQVENPLTGSHGPASSGFIVLEQSISGLTVTDDVGTIVGNVALHGFTDDTRPTLTGTIGNATLGLLETVAIYDNFNGVNSKIGDATLSGTSWTFTPGLLAPLGNGAHTFTAVIQPQLSLTSAGRVISSPYDVVVDGSSTPQQLVVVTSVTDDMSSGSSKVGAVIGTGTLDDTTPTLAGTLSAGLTGAQVVAVYDTVNNVKVRLGYATIDGGNTLGWSFTPTVELGAGSHNFSARVENTASGSQGLESVSFLVTERPVTLTVNDNAGVLQGDVLTYANHVTDDTTLALSGTIGTPLGLLGGLLEQVRVYDNGNYLGQATVSGTNWSYNLNGLTVGSNHDISVRITDFLGLNYTVATGGQFSVASADLPATTSDTSYSSAAVARLALAGTNNQLDLTKVSGAAQPQIDVVGIDGGNGTVKLALADVLQGGTNLFSSATGWAGVTGTGKHQMVIEGAAGAVNVTDGTWSSVGTTSHNGHSYTVYENSTHLAQLLIESQLTRSGAIG